ncbi:MAG: phosphatidate cytidylyltransferase [Muribaculum sp.]|nr:phosphatidate cytidylyltransferase [Muribaculum sp.]
MHKFLVRAASGIVYAAVIILAITYGGWAMFLLAAAFAVIGIIELDRMEIGISDKTLPIFLLDIFGVLSLLGIAANPYSLVLWIGLQIVRFILARKLEKNSEGAIKVPSLGQVYLGLPFAFMIADPIQRLPLLIFIMLWLNDSGAYIVGSLMGKHKMSPMISPKKTWEGFFGGVIITMIGGFLLFKFASSFFGMSFYSAGVWLTLSLSTCIFGTFGDLLESKIKRKYGFKDSGNWIPGHGGLLDRIDSFLIAYPVAFLFLFLRSLFA